jgi:transposase
MRYVGIDIAAEVHVVAVDGQHGVVLRLKFTEDAPGHETPEPLGGPEDTLVAMEATGHYWRNVFGLLVAHGFAVALLNPLRTRRFADEDLQRTKTDAIDALSIARFSLEKRPAATRLPDGTEDELRELVRLRDRLVQTLGDRARQLHRLVGLGFPEFPRLVRSLDSELATAILQKYPTAEAFRTVPVGRLAQLCFDGRHRVGRNTPSGSGQPGVSVGRHHGQAYQIQVRYLCEILPSCAIMRIGDIEAKLEATRWVRCSRTSRNRHPNRRRLIAECGRRHSGARMPWPPTWASFRLKQSGKRRPSSRLAPHGADSRLPLDAHAGRRSEEPMVTKYYLRLRARGKLAKVALVATMRKLLHAVYWIANHRRPFVFTSPERQIVPIQET